MLNQQLLQALDSNLNANHARLKNLCLLVSAVLLHRTVNLVVLATTPDGKQVSNESRYRRFQDFFQRFELCLPSVGRIVLSRIPKPSPGYLLAMDRTNWQFGRRDINFLVIAIVVGTVSIPVVWMVLPKKTKRGNSNAKQRIALTKSLLKLISAKDIEALTMDREFIGKQWLTWLDDHGVSYVVRIKKNVIVGKHQAEELARRRGRKPMGLQDVFGLRLFFSCKATKSNGRASHLFVVSNRFQGSEALELYRRRWGIERLFGHLKKKGFDLEATHMTDGVKLEKLFAVVVLAFLFSFAWGCHLRVSNRRTSRQSQRKSLFRLGLEDILQLLNQPSGRTQRYEELKEFLHWLKRTKFNSIFLVQCGSRPFNLNLEDSWS